MLEPQGDLNMTTFNPASLIRALAVSAALTCAVAQQPTITPTAKELNKSFDADAGQWTQRFEHEGRAIYDKRMEILDAMGLKPGMDVADIGAGSGLISRLIAGRVAPNGTAYAVDIARNMIDYITKTAQQEKITNLKAVLGDPHSPRLAPNSVDVICIIDSYHHFEFPTDMLTAISKALRPDGTLVLIDFKRIDGVSRDYILKMVRAGEGTFTDEFLNAGFDLVERRDDMFPENYLLKFRHRAAPAKTAAAAARQ
jgi:cyclopropane fatty-acyl-phospholipid synthase-like methyltransferase